MDDTLSTTALVLVQARLLDHALAHQHEQTARAKASRLLTHLVQHTHLCPITMAQCLANHFGLPLINLTQIDPQTLPLTLLTPAFLRHHHVLPIRCEANQLYLAVDDPSEHRIVNEIQFLTGHRVLLMVAQTTQLSRMLEEVLRETEHHDLSEYARTQSHTLIMPAPAAPDEAPIVSFVYRLLHQAIASQATDLHFEPYIDTYRVRYRKDGLLHELATPPQDVAARIAARLKIMAELDIAERRLPQDGRFSIKDKTNRTIDCRFSSCPTMGGEKITIRILNHATQSFSLPELGLIPRDAACLQHALSRPQGLILVTGPTGSGKTVTLYAAINHLNTGEKNISSVEDPIEIQQPGINQVQINPKIGLGFASVLRALMRQDPDVIMVGEIRDQDTAEMAIRASQTGHLVLSTLHTNSSAQTLIRLQQLGIPTYLIAESLTLIIAQRLIRRLCVLCKRPSDQTDRGYQPVGCHQCHEGYNGRLAIFETMPISTTLRHLLLTPTITTEQLTYQAQQEGMLTLYDTGLNLVHTGATSYAEIQAFL
jgi:type IV pilus assembly protein PilB